MMKKFKEYKSLNLPNDSREILDYWEKHKIFEKSVKKNSVNKPYIFYEGPPSANGMPGIHHVMARTIKDIFCRYKTLKGFLVERKAGWDTHGLPVELSVEKALNISKEDIGNKISIEEYNNECKKTVMKYTHVWNKLTSDMGYWVDTQNPYITYQSKYMESVWSILSKLYDKNLIYKGYTIQPFSPAAGTGLSSHELNQPGCYKMITDTSAIALFELIPSSIKFSKLKQINSPVFALAWTTTPWTLPSNTALCVGENIQYSLVETFNQYDGKNIIIIIAKNLIHKQLVGKYFQTSDVKEFQNYKHLNKKIPFRVLFDFKGKDIVGVKYKQLLNYAKPYQGCENAFRIISGDFVTTDDGTGIVHIAPTFGADDSIVAKKFNIPSLLVMNKNNQPIPIVNFQGKFISGMGDLSGMYVKNEFYEKNNRPKKSVDVIIIINLKVQSKLFYSQKYEHSYPHCWRTDKPILYYPLDSWFIKTTEYKNKLIKLNDSINWKPNSTGIGRFKNWLENLNDWNLSRSRFWGIPIPIWSTKDESERICIGSIEELYNECEKSLKYGIMKHNPLKDFVLGDFSDINYSKIDLHKNYVDKIILCSSDFKPMYRENDLIDVWFDSGSMPYAQHHYPFENKNLIDENKNFPADFIAEGVDQTRGWFFTLHVISTMCFNSVAFKNVISNGLVLDKNGSKMSKRLGNSIDPFLTISKYGPDATRWYMISNSQPWDNLKFDLDGITEIQRKFFGTLHNTYSFFALYANIDGFNYSEKEIDFKNKPEIDRWIISSLNSLLLKVELEYENYEPTKVTRLIQKFVTENLSNWYVRLCRRRFWKGDYTEDKVSAYQTLFTCLIEICKISCPISPFYFDKLYLDLVSSSDYNKNLSVHLSEFPVINSKFIDLSLEKRMKLAQNISSMVLSLRKKEKIKVRQPLSKIIILSSDEEINSDIISISHYILTEVNVKKIDFMSNSSDILKKNIKPNFKILGPKYGKMIKYINKKISNFNQNQINNIEKYGYIEILLNNNKIVIKKEDVIINSNEIDGLSISNNYGLTIALDIELTDKLIFEGIARELINRIQNLRKEKKFNVTDKIILYILCDNKINEAIINNKDYICEETLIKEINFLKHKPKSFNHIEFNNLKSYIEIKKC
ncbi:MAG: isoleucine--tRNA ligase [Flavobacteriales bacterium TMED288]|nr:isoleucine--tRNA ligase [Flavobacteriales bacterium]RPG52953.1 MAG: isoleucine--tRNA ligase [Flavobacteriales bacterium TMED288]